MTVRAPGAQQVHHLADDSLRVAQIAPPDVDDLPAELTQHPLAAGVSMLGRRVSRATPSSGTRRRPCGAGRRGRARRGGCRRECARDTRRRDGCRPWRGPVPRFAGTSCAGSRLSIRSPSSINRAGGPERPRRRHALGDGPQLVGRHAHTQCAVERPRGRADADVRGEQGEGAGDRHRRDLADRHQVIEERPARVVHSGPEGGMWVGALAADDVDGLVAARTRRGRAGGRRRHGTPQSRLATRPPPSPGPRR